MLQLLQSLKSGKTELLDIPCPQAKPGHLLIQSSYSLISAGTERMLVEFGKSNLIQKARSQPDKVRQVFDKIKTDGLAVTLEAVKSKLDTSIPLGYCNVGKVIGVGKGVESYQIGDRVISNGSHAEVVCVPENLCAKVPDTVSDESASFTVLSAIALQGIRLAEPTLGERFVVMGLGLVGLLTVQLLRANGCEVLTADFVESRCKLAEKFGATSVNLSNQDIIKFADIFSEGKGVDGVLLCASTDSQEPIHQAAIMCRQRGRIVCTGVVGLNLSRDDFYKKELTFQVSCSYGPGRYDLDYEAKGQDYPFGLVRWTENRNFQAILQLMKSNHLDIKSLISDVIDFDDAQKAYGLLGQKNASLGMLLKYKAAVNLSKSVKTNIDRPAIQSDAIKVAVIGAGNYAKRMLIPAFSKTSAHLNTIVSQAGISAAQVGKQFSFSNICTDFQSAIKDEENNLVVIATQHCDHASMTCDALNHGKSVFVEKPLAITKNGLSSVKQAYENQLTLGNAPQIMVGFNRRFSPLIQIAKTLLTQDSSPKSFVMTVNAGHIPSDHWTQDLKVGGGRLIGEACHFVDLLRYLADAKITNQNIVIMDSQDNDTFIIQLQFENGCIGTIQYFANGNRKIAKERLEIYANGNTLMLDNFRVLHNYGFKGKSKYQLKSQDKGNRACVKAFVDAMMSEKSAPIIFDEIVEVTECCLKLI